MHSLMGPATSLGVQPQMVLLLQMQPLRVLIMPAHLIVMLRTLQVAMAIHQALMGILIMTIIMTTLGLSLIELDLRPGTH